MLEVFRCESCQQYTPWPQAERMKCWLDMAARTDNDTSKGTWATILVCYGCARSIRARDETVPAPQGNGGMG